MICDDIFHLHFIDNIVVLKDVWIVGDKFLQEVFHSLPAMRREAKVSKTQ